MTLCNAVPVRRERRVRRGFERGFEWYASEPKIAHLFRFPAGGKHLCVPQKNGNRNFGALLHAAWVGSPPADEKDLLEHMHRYDLPAGKLRNGHIYFVARNPYARLLSEFLNHQVGQCVRGSLGCAATTNLPANRTGFETWVSTLYQRWLNSGRDTCKLGNKHLCSQLSGCAYPPPACVRVLHLEKQRGWFGCLLRQTAVSSALLVGEAWRPFAGTPCYLPNSTGACVDWADAAASETAESVFVGPVHGTAASNQLDVYYTPLSVHHVSVMYARDIAVLGYEHASPLQY